MFSPAERADRKPGDWVTLHEMATFSRGARGQNTRKLGYAPRNGNVFAGGARGQETRKLGCAPRYGNVLRRRSARSRLSRRNKRTWKSDESGESPGEVGRAVKMRAAYAPACESNKAAEAGSSSRQMPRSPKSSNSSTARDTIREQSHPEPPQVGDRHARGRGARSGDRADRKHQQMRFGQVNTIFGHDHAIMQACEDHSPAHPHVVAWSDRGALCTPKPRRTGAHTRYSF